MPCAWLLDIPSRQAHATALPWLYGGELAASVRLRNARAGSSKSTTGRVAGLPCPDCAHVANLRRKIEPDPARLTRILSVRGVGYKLAAV